MSDRHVEVEPSRRRQASPFTQVDEAAFRVTSRVTDAMTRRGLLARLGGVGAVAAAAALGGPWKSVQSASAEPRDACGPWARGCGPSPFCKNFACNSGGNCKQEQPYIKRRYYSSLLCAPNGTPNCWIECCSGTKKRCCDCCVHPDASNGTKGCENCANPNLRACICRSSHGGC